MEPLVHGATFPPSFLPLLCLSLMLSKSEQLRSESRARTKKRNNFLRKFSHSFFILFNEYKERSHHFTSSKKTIEKFLGMILKFNQQL